MDLHKVKRLLGHKTSLMTQRYAHHIPGEFVRGREHVNGEPARTRTRGRPLDKSSFVDTYIVMVAVSASLKKSVALFHALSDETRLALLERLKGGEHCVCELTDAMSATQSRLSFHLKVLKDAGLIQDRRQGRWMYYSIDPGAIEELETAVDRLKQAPKVAVSANRCC